MRLIIDSHLDLAWNALGWDRDLTLSLGELNASEAGLSDSDARGRATTCWPELRKAGVAVCLATVLARVKPEVPAGERQRRRSIDYGHAAAACGAAQGQLAYYRLLERQGELVFLRTAGDLARHWQRWQSAGDGRPPLGIILAMEGADPVVSPEECETWWHDGLRSLSLAHYGPSRYAVGSGAEGPVTAEGRRLLAEMQRLGMILDVTHLSEPGFWEALDLFPGPLMASHNNCRALVPGDRQFSDEQLRRLLERDTVIGVALDAWMLYPGWKKNVTGHDAVTLDSVCDHVDYICQMAGDCGHAAIGSDLDGGYGTEQTPAGLESIADLQKLSGILARRGYSDRDIDAVFHGNWLRFFERHLPQ
ncbi:MAG: dipeptidase [Thermoguttaceae bacterium]